MTHLKKGDPAPPIEGTDQHGNPISLENYKGKKLILYFYPKDNTPTCTAEACNLRDHFEQLRKAGFEILGVSPDSARRHKNFIEKHKLPFPLLVDEDLKTIKAYGVWGEKSMFGKKYFGVLRTTFVIDENGHIEAVITDVDAHNHAQQILDVLGVKS